MEITARELFHRLLEEGDLDYEIYIVNKETDLALPIEKVDIFEDVIEFQIKGGD